MYGCKENRLLVLSAKSEKELWFTFFDCYEWGLRVTFNLKNSQIKFERSFLQKI